MTSGAWFVESLRDDFQIDIPEYSLVDKPAVDDYIKAIGLQQVRYAKSLRYIVAALFWTESAFQHPEIGRAHV